MTALVFIIFRLEELVNSALALLKLCITFRFVESFSGDENMERFMKMFKARSVAGTKTLFTFSILK